MSCLVILQHTPKPYSMLGPFGHLMAFDLLNMSMYVCMYVCNICISLKGIWIHFFMSLVGHERL